MFKRLVLALVTLVVFVPSVFAWEFSMTGEFEWRYRYFGRVGGSKDLYGDMNVQNFQDGGNLIGFAGPNYYRGYGSG